MKPFIHTLLAVTLIFSSLLLSCSDDDPGPDPTAGLIKVAEGFASGAAMKVILYAEEDLFAGYNRLTVAVYDSIDGKRITNASIRLYPVMTMPTMSHSCPVENPAEEAVDGVFPAAILFTMPSGEMGSWTLETEVRNPNTRSTGTIVFTITVAATTPARVISFSTDDGQRYYLSYRFAYGPKVGSNPFEVIAFRREGNSFLPAEDLAMIMTPEMPSMDHGSPNNQNPVSTGGGHYAGTVNFTMTGEWRINLELSAKTASLGTRYFDIMVP